MDVRALLEQRWMKVCVITSCSIRGKKKCARRIVAFPSQLIGDGTPVCTAESSDAGVKNYYRLSHLNKSQISEGVLWRVEGGFVKLGVDKNLLDYVYGAKKTIKQQHGVPLSTHICMNSPVLSVSNMSSCEDRISQSCWSCSEEAWRPCECSRAWTLSCLPDWPGDSSELLELTSDLEDDRTNSARIKPVCDLQWTAD